MRREDQKRFCDPAEPFGPGRERVQSVGVYDRWPRGAADDQANEIARSTRRLNPGPDLLPVRLSRPQAQSRGPRPRARLRPILSRRAARSCTRPARARPRRAVKTAGVAIVTSPHPERSAASPARQAAPVLPREPAIINTFPTSPLLAAGCLREAASHAETISGSTRLSLDPAAWISSRGEPMSATTNLSVVN